MKQNDSINNQTIENSIKNNAGASVETGAASNSEALQSGQEYPVFTKEMKQTHTILLPMMLPVHFSFLEQILRQYGYKTKLLTNDGKPIVDEGLKNVHNDTCYPALLVIGQMIDALKSGKHDPDKTALMITQTGGGCRASNYLFLLRKALKNAGFGNVPVISLNLAGLDKSPGFNLTPSMMVKFVYAVILGDFFMLLKNQCQPYELHQGDTEKLVERWTKQIVDDWKGKPLITGRSVKRYYRAALQDFAAIPRSDEKKIKVGIVGEIYVKYSPMGNNHLEDFLRSEGAEVVVPGLLDFCMYCAYNGVVGHRLYGKNTLPWLGGLVAYRIFLSKQNQMIREIQRHGVFDPPMAFNHTIELTERYISQGVKMGEGWLLTSEMAELIQKGVNNIVCTQPFGCLPNHIVAKGMMNKIKEIHPGANIVAIDYDPGTSEVNQQNRLKLMLANAAVQLKQELELHASVPAKKEIHRPGKTPVSKKNLPDIPGGRKPDAPSVSSL